MGALDRRSAFVAEEGLIYNLVHEPPDVLPEFPSDHLDDLISRLAPNDIDVLIRHKILPVAGMPPHVSYGVTTDHGLHEARVRELEATAQLDTKDLHATIFRVLGPAILSKAVFGLMTANPMASARWRLMPRQALGVLACVIGLALLYVLAGHTAVLLVLSFTAGLFFSLVIALRILCLLPVGQQRPESPRHLGDEDLPDYTVLVPLFHETAVLRQLISAMKGLNYPVGKLDIKLILEEDDLAMRQAVAALDLSDPFEVIVVPRGTPQTKPRALNYALSFARGSLVTIYDGEDIPEPDQLLKSASRFADGSDDLACLQARLSFYNANENWLTRQFTAEYAALFNIILPGLAANHLPLPLGGTSNHFRIAALFDVGAWDPFNVTEDADLGYRLSRHGYRTGVLDSTTYEEAVTQWPNWMKQRRRWLKGFFHTWLVHMRQPTESFSKLGWDGFWTLQAMTLGVFMSALLHPFLLAHTIWFFVSGDAAQQSENPLRALSVGMSVAILVAGFGVAILSAAAGLKANGFGIRGWGSVLLSVPFYWLLMTPAAWMALWDFIRRPHHWHKTKHGQSQFIQAATRKRSARFPA